MSVLMAPSRIPLCATWELKASGSSSRKLFFTTIWMGAGSKSGGRQTWKKTELLHWQSSAWAYFESEQQEAAAAGLQRSELALSWFTSSSGRHPQMELFILSPLFAHQTGGQTLRVSHEPFGEFVWVSVHLSCWLETICHLRLDVSMTQKKWISVFSCVDWISNSRTFSSSPNIFVFQEILSIDLQKSKV